MNTDHVNRQQIEALLDRYKAGSYTADDSALLEDWYHDHNFQSADLDEADIRSRLMEVKLTLLKVSDVSNVKSRLIGIKLWPKVAAAASIFIVAVTIYIMMFSKSDVEELRIAALNAGITPGGNKAVLTLPNGRRIILNNAVDGEIIHQNGVVITKEKDGTVVYRLAPALDGTIQNLENWNTIQTPKGGQYQVVLSDGSKVWLNAQSTLRFPSEFSQEMREVIVSGEAYFKITKQTVGTTSLPVPFVVQAGRQKVRVLGTQFNINSYQDEQTVKTTLVEGSIAVSFSEPTAHHNTRHVSKPIILRPGEQSELLNTGAIRLKTVDVEKSVDWQKGNFVFKNEDIYQIMRKVARWYDIKVVYESDLPTDKIGGTLSRYQDVSKIFDIVQRTGLFKFKIEGKTVYVRKA